MPGQFYFHFILFYVVSLLHFLPIEAFQRACVTCIINNLAKIREKGQQSDKPQESVLQKQKAASTTN